MKRSVLCGLSLAAVVLSLGLVGCGGAGVDEGAPQGDVTKPAVPLDPKMVDVTGKMGPGAAATAAKAAQKKAATPAEEPAKKE